MFAVVKTEQTRVDAPTNIRQQLVCTTVRQQHCGNDGIEGLIVILCRDGALSRPG